MCTHSTSLSRLLSLRSFCFQPFSTVISRTHASLMTQYNRREMGLYDVYTVQTRLGSTTLLLAAISAERCSQFTSEEIQTKINRRNISTRDCKKKPTPKAVFLINIFLFELRQLKQLNNENFLYFFNKLKSITKLRSF